MPGRYKTPSGNLQTLLFNYELLSAAFSIYNTDTSVIITHVSYIMGSSTDLESKGWGRGKYSAHDKYRDIQGWLERGCPMSILRNGNIPCG